MPSGVGDSVETDLLPRSLFPSMVDLLLKGGASNQQPGQRGGVVFSSEAWAVRQESSSQRLQGKKDPVDKVLVSEKPVQWWCPGSSDADSLPARPGLGVPVGVNVPVCVLCR